MAKWTDAELRLEYLGYLCNHAEFTGEQPSLLVISAHPDDEVIGLGAKIPELKNLTFIHTTDGAPRNMKDANAVGFNSREEYAKKRYDEFCSVMQLAGHPVCSCIELGYVDQESAFNLVKMTNDLLEIFSSLEPDVIITHPYEGGHPDHDSTAFAVHHALKKLRQKGNPGKMPVLLEFSSYFSDNGRMVTFDFLPDSRIEKYTSLLSPEKQLLKERMFDCFGTQRNVLQYFPVSLEAFRSAPEYDFTKEPHEGRLYYEYFDWGVKGEQWRSLASEAIMEILRDRIYE